MLRPSPPGRITCLVWLVALALAAGFVTSSARAQPLTPAQPQATPLPQSDDALTLDDMPDIGLDWPDLAAPATPLPAEEPALVDGSALPAQIPIMPADGQSVDAGSAVTPAQPGSTGASAINASQADALAALDPSVPLRYRTTLEGIGDAGDALLRTRFDALSALKQAQGDRANIAQIRRRGESDVELVNELLRVRGYYESRTRLRLGIGSAADALVDVSLNANPGRRYLLDAVEVFGLEGESPLGGALRRFFEVKVGDPADTDLILAATAKLRTELGQGGYPFADVREPVLTVDHQQRQAILNLNVNTGGFRRFGNIIVNEEAPFDARHVGVISRFGPGEAFKQSDVTDLNRAIIATGLVSQVTITPKQGETSETVDLVVNMSAAPPRTISGQIGYGTGEGARIEASWQHRNFFPPEGALTLRGVLGTQEQSLVAVLRRNNLGRRDRALNVEIGAANLNQPAYEALTAGISGSFEQHTNIIFQKEWTWSFGAELRISDESSLYGQSPVPVRRTYVIAALPTSLTYDDSDDLLDPTRGFRLGGRLSPELSLQNGAFGYVRAQMDASAYLPVSERITIAGRVRIGTIVGAEHDRIAPTRRFYAGGGGSVRGYGYQAIGPRDLNNNPEGGRSLGELALEARIRFGGANQFGIVPFIDAGTISSQALPTLSELRVGAGLGFRYYSNFGPIRIDVGTPINPQPGDSRVGVYVSLGQAF